MNDIEVKKIIESLLFTWGDPLELKDIASILEIKKSEVKNLLDEMIIDFNLNRGLKIIKMNESYQIGTSPEHFEWIQKLEKNTQPKTLSNAALETLSIIAYKQPVIKSDIEYIRGVKCDKAIQTLLEKSLIEEQGRLDKTGRPIIYGTTDEFLKVFGLTNIEELPSLDNLNKDLLNYDMDEE